MKHQAGESARQREGADEDRGPDPGSGGRRPGRPRGRPVLALGPEAEEPEARSPRGRWGRRESVSGQGRVPSSGSAQPGRLAGRTARGAGPGRAEASPEKARARCQAAELTVGPPAPQLAQQEREDPPRGTKRLLLLMRGLHPSPGPRHWTLQERPQLERRRRRNTRGRRERNGSQRRPWRELKKTKNSARVPGEHRENDDSRNKRAGCSGDHGGHEKELLAINKAAHKVKVLWPREEHLQPSRPKRPPLPTPHGPLTDRRRLGSLLAPIFTSVLSFQRVRGDGESAFLPSLELRRTRLGGGASLRTTPSRTREPHWCRGPCWVLL